MDEWANGGATDDDNQISLCPFHHDAVDRRDFHISGDPTRADGLVVTNRYGVLVQSPSPDELAQPPGGDPPVPDAAYQPPTGENARWADIEIPPDRELPGPGPLRLVRLRPQPDAAECKGDHAPHPHAPHDHAPDASVPHDHGDSWLDRSGEDQVFDSYRAARRHGSTPP